MSRGSTCDSMAHPLLSPRRVTRRFCLEIQRRAKSDINIRRLDMGSSMRSRLLCWAFIFFAVVGTAAAARAGSIFLTGHDPDFHGDVGGNAAGAQKINTTAIGFIQDPAFNPF